MKKFASIVVKHKILVLIIAGILVIPSIYGMMMTNINYDILSYLPDDIGSVEGQKIMSEAFGNSSTSFIVIEDIENKEVKKIKEKIAKLKGIDSVIWADDVFDTSIPKEFLPSELREIFFSDNATLLVVKFSYNSASDETQNAIDEIRLCLDKHSYFSGAGVVIKDLIEIADKETPVYVGLAVLLATIVLALTLSSTIVPFIFLIGIGVAILYNMGSNILFGEISYITKSLAAVLQLGVTMDYSIFLFHRYEDEREKHTSKHKAMAEAISSTFSSIFGSSLTTIAGFLALCVMLLTLGTDIGFVMAKGVLIGVISTVTILPSLILVFDKWIHKFNHGTILPSFEKTSKFIVKHYKLIFIVFLILIIPSYYAQSQTEVYYNLEEALPEDMPSIIGLNKMKTEFDMTTTHMILLPSELESYKSKEVIEEIENLNGINSVVAYEKYLGSMVNKDFFNKDILEKVEKGGYKVILVNSSYKSASKEVNKQIDKIKSILDSYSDENYIAGEGALKKDLIEIADIDLKNVSIASIAAICLIIMIIFKSITIPLILVVAIQLAIFINMGIPYYTKEIIPFVSSIVIGTIQLGATVDYAILLTTRFKEEIRINPDKFIAMEITLKSSIRSIVTSALTFFGATIGVAFVSKVEITSSLTQMISRGAVISMVIIVVVLPALLLVFEGLINKTTLKWKR